LQADTGAARRLGRRSTTGIRLRQGKSAIVGPVRHLGSVKFHGTFGDTRVGNGGALAIRDNMAGMTVGSSRGTICASLNRYDIRDFPNVVSDQRR
jgi:hypothetical protein